MDEFTTKETLTRRQVLKTAAGAGMGLALLLPILREQANADSDDWVAAGKAETFVKDQPQQVTLKNGDVLYITRTDDKTLTAVSAKCTHHGCELGWDQSNVQLLCPCHGAAFTPSGKNLHGTVRRPQDALPPLPSVPVREKDGQVEVNLQGIAASDLQPNRSM